MRKTVWYIFNETLNIETELTYYHFGAPEFPSWYMEKNTVYIIEMLWCLNLKKTPSLFFKCLFHHFIIK